MLTLTHRFAKLKAIGELVAAFEGDDLLRDRLNFLRDSGKLSEVFYLATCNRLLLLFSTSEEVDIHFKQSLLGEDTPPSVADMKHLRGLEAIRHLYEVAASIRSLVVGERQILGQIRESYERCRDWGLIGDDLRIVLNQTVLAAKDVYANTRIGEKSVSIVSLAMQQLQRQSPSRRSRILMIGAGQTNMLVSKFLRKQGYADVTIANRTLARAEQLAAGFERGRALALTGLRDYDRGFDILFVCTGATEATLTPELFQRLLAGEAAAGKIVVDLGLPADTHEEVSGRDEVTYIDIEQLKRLASENLDFRRREVQRANGVLEKHLSEVSKLYQQRLLERAMSGLPSEIKAIRHTAVTKIFRKELEGLDPEARALMDRMMAYMEKRCIGIPMKAAREAIIE